LTARLGRAVVDAFLRLGRAAADVLARPALSWAIAAAFWLRVAILTALPPTRNDAEGMWEGAHAYPTDPSHMYDAAARYIARFHILAPPAGLDEFVSPPPLAALAAPVALLPRNVAVQVWTAIDSAAVLVALFLLYRLVASRHPLARPAFWLVAAYFPPLFSDIVAGQRGGILLLGAIASIALEASRPALAGTAGGIVAALKYYPAAMVIGPRPQHRVRYAVALGAALLV